MEITNPGVLLPSIRLERLIDMAPESRNESFAALMHRLGICEERGSGIDKALFAVVVYGLPPVKFVNGPNAFKAILYSPRTFKQMSPDRTSGGMPSALLYSLLCRADPDDQRII